MGSWAIKEVDGKSSGNLWPDNHLLHRTGDFSCMTTLGQVNMCVYTCAHGGGGGICSYYHRLGGSQGFMDPVAYVSLRTLFRKSIKNYEQS